jgi:light-regulated signal transduction histidine kinase (bacteriophytochrome)
VSLSDRGQAVGPGYGTSRFVESIARGAINLTKHCSYSGADQRSSNLPEHGTVWVIDQRSPQRVVLTVEKLTPQLAATLTSRFRAAPNADARTTQASGLGLAIVKSITQAHDGNLTLGPLAGSASRCNYPPRHRTLAQTRKAAGEARIHADPSRRTAPL